MATQGNANSAAPLVARPLLLSIYLRIISPLHPPLIPSRYSVGGSTRRAQHGRAPSGLACPALSSSPLVVSCAKRTTTPTRRRTRRPPKGRAGGERTAAAALRHAHMGEIFENSAVTPATNHPQHTGDGNGAAFLDPQVPFLLWPITRFLRLSTTRHA